MPTFRVLRGALSSTRAVSSFWARWEICRGCDDRSYSFGYKGCRVFFVFCLDRTICCVDGCLRFRLGLGLDGGFVAFLVQVGEDGEQRVHHALFSFVLEYLDFFSTRQHELSREGGHVSRHIVWAAPARTAAARYTTAIGGRASR